MSIRERIVALFRSDKVKQELFDRVIDNGSRRGQCPASPIAAVAAPAVVAVATSAVVAVATAEVLWVSVMAVVPTPVVSMSSLAGARGVTKVLAFVDGVRDLPHEEAWLEGKDGNLGIGDRMPGGLVERLRRRENGLRATVGESPDVRTIEGRVLLLLEEGSNHSHSLRVEVESGERGEALRHRPLVKGVEELKQVERRTCRPLPQRSSMSTTSFAAEIQKSQHTVRVIAHRYTLAIYDATEAHRQHRTASGRFARLLTRGGRSYRRAWGAQVAAERAIQRARAEKTRWLERLNQAELSHHVARNAWSDSALRRAA